MTVRAHVVPALPWIVGGVAFAAYPALRPWTDETTTAGLRAMAGRRWVVAHLLGMIGFVALAVGIRARAARGVGTRVQRALPGLAGLAVVLLLPYYGGEAFGLHAIGRYAVAHDDLGLLAVVDGFRYQPLALVLFGLGLLTLAVVGALLVVDAWSAGSLFRLAALGVGLPLALYLPQFYGPPAVRITHGVVLGLGCVMLGLLVTVGDRQNNRGESEPSSSISQRLVSSSRPGSPPL